MTVIIDETKCTGCGICARACPVEAITVDRIAKINADTCIDCGSCVAECPNDAIIMEGMEILSPSRGHTPPSSHLSATRAAISPIPPWIFGNPRGVQQINGRGGLLERIFDFFVGLGGGRGYGRGRGGGVRRGRGNRRRP